MTSLVIERRAVKRRRTAALVFCFRKVFCKKPVAAFLHLALIVALLAGLAGPALAVSPDEILDDPVLEQRARDISAGLRCLVCQNQSIDDSDADLARSLRLLVRERLLAGDSDAEIERYLVARYGEYVLLRPRFNAYTLALWVAAPALLAIGIVGLVVARRRAARSSAALATSAGLSAQEAAVLRELAGEADETR